MLFRSIGRAILKKPDLYLIDDTLAGLDYKTANLIYETITSMEGIKFITSNTYLETDYVLFLENGQQVAFDTHQNLMRKNKKYKKLMGGNV